MSIQFNDDLTAIKVREIQELYYRVVNNQIAADQTWLSVLTDRDRQQIEQDHEKLNSFRSRAISIVTIYAQLRNCSISLAVIEIARDLGLTSPINFKRLLKEIDESSTPAIGEVERPSWSRETGELKWGELIIRRVTRFKQPSRLVEVLDAFENQGWPSRIDDPVKKRDPVDLNDTVRTLNKNLKIIEFRSDGTASGIRWNKRDTGMTQG